MYKRYVGVLFKSKTRNVDFGSFFLGFLLKECRDKELFSRQGIRCPKRRENENNTKGYRCEFVSVRLKQNSSRSHRVRRSRIRDLL